MIQCTRVTAGRRQDTTNPTRQVTARHLLARFRQRIRRRALAPSSSTCQDSPRSMRPDSPPKIRLPHHHSTCRNRSVRARPTMRHNLRLSRPHSDPIHQPLLTPHHPDPFRRPSRRLPHLMLPTPHHPDPLHRPSRRPPHLMPRNSHPNSTRRRPSRRSKHRRRHLLNSPKTNPTRKPRCHPPRRDKTAHRKRTPARLNSNPPARPQRPTQKTPQGMQMIRLRTQLTNHMLPTIIPVRIKRPANRLHPPRHRPAALPQHPHQHQRSVRASLQHNSRRRHPPRARTMTSTTSSVT